MAVKSVGVVMANELAFLLELFDGKQILLLLDGQHADFVL
jgi:hypothetical protein